MEKKPVAKLGKKPLTYSTLVVLQLTDDPSEFIELRNERVPYGGPWAKLDRALQNQAKTAANTATSTASGYGANAGQIAGTLTPTLERQATTPQGFSPTDVNNMTVAGAEAAGGANATVAGRAGDAAARSRNVGSLSAVQDQAARDKEAQLSKNALGVQNLNAGVKQQQQQSALNQLTKLYGTNVGAQTGNAGQVSGDVNAGVNAGNSGWLQNTTGILKGLQGAGGSVPGGGSFAV